MQLPQLDGTSQAPDASHDGDGVPDILDSPKLRSGGASKDAKVPNGTLELQSGAVHWMPYRCINHTELVYGICSMSVARH